MAYYVNKKKRNSVSQLSFLLQKCIRNCTKEWDELIFLCIGSDRITGDSLGPFIGQQLSCYQLPKTFIYGTLDTPVHALNLRQTLANIGQKHPLGLIIAIDASLGEKKHLGYITVGNGSIHPGAGVHKTLPAAGDIYITGIVSSCGLFEQLSLQNTRLSLVLSMANIITRAIIAACFGKSHHRLFLSDALFHFPEGRRRKETKLPPLAAFTDERS